MGVMKRAIEKKLDRISRDPERIDEKHFERWWNDPVNDVSLKAKKV